MDTLARRTTAAFGLFLGACGLSSPTPIASKVGFRTTPLDVVSPSEIATSFKIDSDELIDTATPLYVQTQPNSECIFHPAGLASPKDPVFADNNGRVRFYPPPSAWGSNLVVECSAAAGAMYFSGDISDRSIFHLDTDALNKKAPSVLPALTGDLMAIEPLEIFQRGYPPRPDKSVDPEAYARWVAIVSVPRGIQPLTFIAALGHYASHYSGRFNSITPPSAAVWAGRAYDGMGWTAYGTPNAPYSYNYAAYGTTFKIPGAGGCPAGRSCTTYAWGGIGGMEPYGDAGLIQSGIALQQTNGPVPFIEYYPGPPLLGSAIGTLALSGGDKLYTWGYSSTSTSCPYNVLSANGTAACFGFFNYTTGMYLTSDNSGFAGTPSIAKPSGATFYGWTFESIVEKPTPGSGLLASFSDILFDDYGYDVYSTYHDVTSDPWIFLDSYWNGAGSNHLICQTFNSGGGTGDTKPSLVQWVSSGPP